MVSVAVPTFFTTIPAAILAVRFADFKTCRQAKSECRYDSISCTTDVENFFGMGRDMNGGNGTDQAHAFITAGD